MIRIPFTDRQQNIIDIVRMNQPITSEQIAEKLNLTRATLRPDLAILTMSGVLEAKPKVGYYYTGRSNLNVISEYLNSVKVSDIKSMPVIVEENTSVYDAIVTLFLEDVGTIFVTNNGYLVGAVSRKDFLKVAIGGNSDLNKIPVGVIMTRMPNIIVTSDEESIVDAARKIIMHEVDSLPVVETLKENGKELSRITGKVSKTNITRFFVQLSNS
ncbi:MAG: helix-turn-helix transcriptional regulator [Thermoanaerobacteraceae bacterium]|nr:helix-turn-helix transcriptional regulator [Thermoanaerobacteraceae bacterium]